MRGLEVVTNREENFARRGYGQDEIILDEEDIEFLLKGESLGYDDGEYTHILKFRKSEEWKK